MDEITEVCTLQNGCKLYIKPNGAGGHQYWSDSIGGGVCVWDTCLTSEEELLAALLHQHQMDLAESRRRYGKPIPVEADDASPSSR